MVERHTNMIRYAGIGARATPPDILAQMKMFGAMLGSQGIMLRSGGAAGADTAFADGCASVHGPGEIFKRSHYTLWIEHASRYHPNWAACSEIARELHARNSAILLGAHLNEPVDFVVCWTPGGGVVGGTGQALRIAAAPEYNIPVINLAVDPSGAGIWAALERAR